MRVSVRHGILWLWLRRPRLADNEKASKVYNAFCDCLIAKLQEGDTDALKVAENFIHRQNIGSLPVPGSKLEKVTSNL